MNKFILLLVLVSGFLSGYLIGDYRGKDARETLQRALATGKMLDADRENAITQLQVELDGINDKHRRELEAIRKRNASQSADWRRARDRLDDRIKRSAAQLAASDARMQTLVAQRDAASGADKARLDQEIGRLRRERDDLQREIDGSACLQARVPPSVVNALTEEANAPGDKR
ncbi:MAG: hypothetical protein HZB47_08395 [Nitrosomonadales bacterium]|nr:hypothetical protein [Nitrosomonadales bacterium]